MKAQDIAVLKRWRGVILELVHTGHREQESRLDDLALWGLMQDLSHDISQNDVITLLQDLKGRGYLKFKQDRDHKTNVTRISKIEIEPKGCDLIERTQFDPAVRLL